MPTYFTPKVGSLVQIEPKLILYHVTKQKYLDKIFTEGLRINCPNSGLSPGNAPYTRVKNFEGNEIKPIYAYHTPDVVAAMISESWLDLEQACVLRIRAEGLILYNPSRGFIGEIAILNDIESWRLKKSMFGDWRLRMMIRRRERLAEAMSRG